MRVHCYIGIFSKGENDRQRAEVLYEVLLAGEIFKKNISGVLWVHAKCNALFRVAQHFMRTVCSFITTMSANAAA